MGADYIPERDYAAASWMKFFARGLTQSPETYFITPEEAAEIDSAVYAFRHANAENWPSGQRSVRRTLIKNVTRKAAEKLIRPMAQRLRTDPRIDPFLKQMIGLKIKTKRRRQIPLPTSRPAIAFDSQLSGIVVLKIRDSESRRRAMPKGAKGLELYERVWPRTASPEQVSGENATAIADATSIADDVEPRNVPEWRFVGVFTRWPIRLQPAIREYGQLVNYRARWITSRGEPCDFGATVSLHPHLVFLRQTGGITRRGNRIAA